MKRATTKLVRTIACSAVVTGCNSDILKPTDSGELATEGPLSALAINERPQALPVVDITASTHRADKVPGNTLDGNLETRWQAWGKGQWIRADLGTVRRIAEVKIAWYRGDTRAATFDVQTSTDASRWTPIFSGKSSGKSRALEPYDVSDSRARYLRIVGHGTTKNDENLIAELQIWGGKSLQEETAREEPPPLTHSSLPIAAVTASAYRGPNVPENTLDRDLDERWQAWGDGQWLRFDLGAARGVSEIKIAWYRGNGRVATFDVQVSVDGKRWRPVFSGESSGSTIAPESYDVADSEARYVRIVGHGTTVSKENMIAYVEILGGETNGEIPPPSGGEEPPPSGGGQAPPPPSPNTNAFFSDNFEGYPVTARPYGSIANGFSWAPGSRGVEVSDDHSFSGTKSLRFTYPGTPSLLGMSSKEKRFVIASDGTTSIDEIWVEFMMRVPDNWEHRAALGPTNNKLMLLWAEKYSNPDDAQVGVNWQRTSNTRSWLMISSVHGNDPRGKATSQNQTMTGAIFDASMRGAWIRLRFHYKLATKGVVEVWRDNEKIAEMPRDWNMWIPGGRNYFRHGYLMGWSNSGFSRETSFYVDDFKIWTVDPNWTFQ